MNIDLFERIENDKLRVIAVRCEPGADFSPGDTVTLKAYFAGNAVKAVGNYSIAYKHTFTDNHYFPDERSMMIVNSDSWFPDSFQFKIKIPEDIFLKEYTIGSVDTNAIKKVIEWSQTRTVPVDQRSIDSLKALAASVSHLFSRLNVFFRAYSENGTELKVRSEVVIRYNNLFKDYLPVNNNPAIKWVAVFKVPIDQSTNFFMNNPVENGSYQPMYLYNQRSPQTVMDTIVIDTGYNYFIGCNRQIELYVDKNGDTLEDTTCDFVESRMTPGNMIPEDYNYKWFFQNMDNVNEHNDSLIVFDYENSGNAYLKISPPVYTSMQHFKLWVVVYDQATDPASRTPGYSMRSVNGVFKYTDAYIKKTNH
jgi:hypothetical protein